MYIAAAKEIAKCAEDLDLADNHIAATMEDWEVFPRVAAAVGMMEQEQGVARLKGSQMFLYKQVSRTIKRAQDLTQTLMKDGYIRPAI